MTIRFTCDECGSVLKIKDELAGTDGKCPKCKKKFVVPQPDAAASSLDHEEAPPHNPVVASVAKAAAEKPAAPPKSTKPAPAAKAGKKPADDDEFDPVSFLMEGPKKRPATFQSDPPDEDRRGGGGLSLDDEPDSPSDAAPAPKRWGARKETSASEAAGRSLGGGGGTGNAARDLLSKSMEESRVRAAEMPEEQPRYRFDFAGFFREFGLKGGGMVAGVVIGVYLLYSLVNSMTVSRIQLPPEMGYVSGKVTYKGKPQPGILVYFSPIEKEIKGSKEKWRASTAQTDETGEFTLQYIDGIEGVKTGRCQVSLETLDINIVIPAAYTARGGTTVDVSKGTNEPYNIDMK